MTENEAIKEVRFNMSKIGLDDKSAKRVSEAKNMAIQALEKQIPKKPVKGNPYYWIDSVKIQGRYRDARKKAYQTICPACSHTVLTSTNFCRDCGQKLDWREDNEVN